MISCRIDNEMRQWLIGPAVFLWMGIYLTGFDVVSWVLYFPAVMFVFALVTGLCPGMWLIRMRKALWRTLCKGEKDA